MAAIEPVIEAVNKKINNVLFINIDLFTILEYTLNSIISIYTNFYNCNKTEKINVTQKHVNQLKVSQINLTASCSLLKSTQISSVDSVFVFEEAWILNSLLSGYVEI